MAFERNPPVAPYPSELPARETVDVPRQPFVFTDPAELAFFKTQPAFTLHRHHDGRRFQFAGCKPVFSDDGLSVVFNVEKVLVTWTDKTAKL